MKTSRRTLLRSTAWAVPAVSVATAAPAFAGSSSLPALVFSVFDVPAVMGGSAPRRYFDLDFRNLTVGAGAGGVPQPVTLTFSFLAQGGAYLGSAVENEVFQSEGPPVGWSSSAGWGPSIAWVSAASVSPAAPLVIQSGGLLLGTHTYEVWGVFTIVASAPGYQSATVTVSTGPMPAARVVGAGTAPAAESRSGRAH